MPIEFRCTQCGQMLRVAESSAGKNARCPGCKAIMLVPAADDLAARSLQPLSQPSPAPAPDPAPQLPSSSPPQQDALFEFLKQATTPIAAHPQAAQPAPFQQPGVLPTSGPFADAPVKQPFGDGPAAASVNPYASPAAAAYPAFGPPTAGERPGLPWEIRGASLGAWWETSQLCLGDAERAFRLMRQTGGIGSPMLFAILGQLIGFLGQLVWSLPGLALQVAAGQGRGNQLAGMEVVATLILQGLGVLFGATIGLLIGAAITHLCLVMVGGANYPFETTYRVAAYTSGSIAWLNVIPCFGPLIVLVMWFVCTIQGLSQAHETTVGKSAAAVFLPIAFCIVVCGAAVAAIIAIVVANQ